MSLFLSPGIKVWLNVNTHRYIGGFATIVKTEKKHRWGYLIERDIDKKRFWVDPGICKEVPKEMMLYSWEEMKNVTSPTENKKDRFKSSCV